MREYETVVVFNAALSQTEIETGVANVKKLLENSGVTTAIEVQDWGRKELPHPAHKNLAGCFYAFVYQTEDYEVVNRANGTLRIMENVFKFQSHRRAERQRRFHGNPKILRTGARPAVENDSLDF